MSMPVKPYPTLKGIFSTPKETHRRDFLRENKLSLRQLEKTTTQKLASKEPIRPKWMPSEQLAAPRRSVSEVGSEQKLATGKRVNTQNRNGCYERAQTPDRRNGRNPVPEKAKASTTQRQKSIDSKLLQQTQNRCQSCGSERSINGSTSVLCDRGIQTDEINDEIYLATALRRCTGSHVDVASDTRSCKAQRIKDDAHACVPQMDSERRTLAKDYAEDTHSRIIQCESRCELSKKHKHTGNLDDTDVELEDDDYQALNDIAAQNIDSHSIDSRFTIVPNDSLQRKPKSTCIDYNGHNGIAKLNPSSTRSRCSLHSKQHLSSERLDVGNNVTANEHNRRNSPSIHSRVSLKTKSSYKSKMQIEDCDDDVELEPNLSPIRSQYSLKSNKPNYRTQPGDSDEDNINDDLSRRFDNVDLELERCVDNYKNEEDGDQLSIHSRQTLRSNITVGTNASKRRPHKLGSRDEVRLPRYLEREKRVKEEEKLRAQLRDPDCPPGHILLTETERLEGLAAAKKKYDGLVNELNRMPMTTQTLRVRTRRAEIDKELGVVDDDIRIFSKPKVYVKCEQF